MKGEQKNEVGGGVVAPSALLLFFSSLKTKKKHGNKLDSISLHCWHNITNQIAVAVMIHTFNRGISGHTGFGVRLTPPVRGLLVVSEQSPAFVVCPFPSFSSLLSSNFVFEVPFRSIRCSRLVHVTFTYCRSLLLSYF